MTINWEPRLVRLLKPNQVFVFGANDYGEHGGGSAGYAHRAGWAKWGVGAGFQHGPNGMSYGIVTVHRGGEMCSTSLVQIRKNVREFFRFAKAHSALQFIVCPLGENLAGWTREDIEAHVWDRVERFIPPNVCFVRPTVVV